jgi:uncharacterized membrane protein YhiD involved in acid resistance
VIAIFSEVFHVEILALGSAVTATVILVVLWLVNGLHRRVESLVNKHEVTFLMQYTNAMQEAARESENAARSSRALAASIIKMEGRLDKIETLLMERSDDRGVDPPV